MELERYPVLFVDDEEANRIVFQASFGQQFRVFVAASGEEALTILAEQHVAVLLTDQRMPGMSGVELAERVRLQYPEVVRIIVTAYSDVHAAIAAINRGQVSRYISKPWNSDEVRAYLLSAIEVRHLGDRIRELQGQVLRSERLVTLGLAASSIAHDLGGPVGCLSNNLEGILHELRQLQGAIATDGGLERRLQDLIELARDTKLVVEDITRILEAVGRSIRARPRREAVDLATVVQTALRLVQTEVIHKAKLNVICDPEVWVVGDAAELTQVVINLLVNAAHAIPRGEQSANLVALQVRAEGERAVLSVKDTGCGIPSELLERIFEPHVSSRLESGGTGLGLAIVQRVVEAHQGTIQLESVVGAGSTFTITLPRGRPNP